MNNSKKIDDGGPAFPTADQGPIHAAPGTVWGGMSLRDYFAAKAMQGIVAGVHAASVDRSLGQKKLWEKNYPGKHVGDILAEQSYAIADAMLAARNA